MRKIKVKADQLNYCHDYFVLVRTCVHLKFHRLSHCRPVVHSSIPPTSPVGVGVGVRYSLSERVWMCVRV